MDSDIGHIKLILTAIFLQTPLSKDKIEEILSRRHCESSVYSLILLEDKVFSIYQLLYPIYLSIRGELTGIRIARKIELNALCYMACTDRIRDAIEALTVQDHAKRLLVVSFCRDCEDSVLVRAHLDLLSKLCEDVSCDVVTCVCCTRLRYDRPHTCSEIENYLDFMEAVASILIKRFE